MEFLFQKLLKTRTTKKNSTTTSALIRNQYLDIRFGPVQCIVMWITCLLHEFARNRNNRLKDLLVNLITTQYISVN